MRQILNFLLLPFYIVMRVFTRRKKRIYWRQKVYNVLGKGGIVMDETGCEIVIPGVKVYVVGTGNRIIINKNINISKKGIISISIFGNNNTLRLQKIDVLKQLSIGFGDSSIPIDNATMEIGAGTSLWQLSMQTYNSNSAIKIGRDCMLSTGINIYHTDGHPADMDALSALAKKHHLFLIEDCAEAIGTRYKGKCVGSFGDIACFSFFGNKTITCGEGGMVVCNNDELFERTKHLKGQGVVSWREYWHDVSAYNYRMTNIQAAIGLAQFEQIDKFVSAKRQIAEWYMEELADTPLVFHKPVGDVFHTFWMVSALTKSAKDRAALRDAMKQAGIETRPTFPCVHQMPVYNKRFEYLPVAEDLSARGINFPSYPALTRDDVKTICNVIRGYYGK